jgi:hypothetical protein
VQRCQRSGEGGLGLREGALIIRVHHASRARAARSGSPSGSPPGGACVALRSLLWANVSMVATTIIAGSARLVNLVVGIFCSSAHNNVATAWQCGSRGVRCIPPTARRTLFGQVGRGAPAPPHSYRCGVIATAHTEDAAMGNGKVPPVRPFPLMAGLPAYWYQVGKGGHGARTTQRCGR